MLTLIPPAEASAIAWAEIDIEKKEWCIPVERMKAKREHVFPSRNDPRKPMNSQTANAALKRIGYGGKLVAHGLWSIASTAMNKAEFNADVIESALAHCDKDEVRRAYNRSTYLEQRRELMEWWGLRVWDTK